MRWTDCTANDIRFDEIEYMTDLPCKRGRCVECIRKINKCYMCRRDIKKSEAFKTYLKLTLQKTIIIRVPLYYDTLNLKIDNILTGIASRR